MKPCPDTTLRLWRAGHDTLAIAEALIGTRYEPEAAARAARRLEPAVARLVARHRDRIYALSARARNAVDLASRRRPSAEIGLASYRSGDVSLPVVRFGEGR